MASSHMTCCIPGTTFGSGEVFLQQVVLAASD